MNSISTNIDMNSSFKVNKIVLNKYLLSAYQMQCDFLENIWRKIIKTTKET